MTSQRIRLDRVRPHSVLDSPAIRRRRYLPLRRQPTVDRTDLKETLCPSSPGLGLQRSSCASPP